MPQFIDPRVAPSPRSHQPVAEVAQFIDQLVELHRLCREGRLYEVEAWIRAGQPLQANIQSVPRGRKIPTALGIALETGQHALTELLLCNGYQLNREPRSPFDVALETRRRDLVDLLLAWNADPHRVTLASLFATYDTALFELFYAAGVDLTRRHALGETLAEHASNKPLFGFAKRHREEDPRVQVELNIALVHHAEEGHLKGVHLCLWAGADPHANTPEPESSGGPKPPEGTDEDEHVRGGTAVEAAVMGGHAEILPLLRPDPARDKWNALYQTARNGPTAAVLAAIAPPRDVGAVLRRQTFWLDDYWPAFDWEPVGVMEQVFKAGGRWIESPPEEIAIIRRNLLKANSTKLLTIMRLLAEGDDCSPAVLAELGRTPRIRQRLTAVGLLPSPRGDHPTWGGGAHQVPGARKIASKLGIPPAKEPKSVPRVVEIGRWQGNEATIRLTRRDFYERVWSEPIESLANAWGLSGRGLAKACKRAGVPVPPRGYWARVQHGQKQRRAPLREVPGTSPTEIVIHIPPKGLLSGATGQHAFRVYCHYISSHLS